MDEESKGNKKFSRFETRFHIHIFNYPTYRKECIACMAEELLEWGEREQ